MAVFRFLPRWKEELAVTGPGGSFALELAMGRLTAYLPTEEAFRLKAPEWARELWPLLHDELRQWCRENDAGFVVDASAPVW